MGALIFQQNTFSRRNGSYTRSVANQEVLRIICYISAGSVPGVIGSELSLDLIFKGILELFAVV